MYADYREQGQDTLLHTGYCHGTEPLSKAGADLEALGPAELALPETVEPESVDLTPVSGIWSFSSERVVAAAIVTLFAFAGVTLLSYTAVGFFLLWRRRRLG